MASRIDGLVAQIAAAYDDAGVSFTAGKLRINEHQQQRAIIFTRAQGDLVFAGVRGANRYGTPVGGQGTVSKQIFKRAEILEVRLRDADEEALDNMLDRFAYAAHFVLGANCFQDRNAYAWHGEDSKNGGAWSLRNPMIILQLAVDLKSIPQNNPYSVVSTTTAEVTELGETVDVIVP